MMLVKIVKLSSVVYILLGKWGDKGQGFIKICANMYTNAGIVFQEFSRFQGYSKLCSSVFWGSLSCREMQGGSKSDLTIHFCVYNSIKFKKTPKPLAGLHTAWIV